jgi:hypothetical protein
VSTISGSSKNPVAAVYDRRTLQMPWNPALTERRYNQKRDHDSHLDVSFSASAIGMNSGPKMPLRRPTIFSSATFITCTTPKCAHPTSVLSSLIPA